MQEQMERWCKQRPLGFLWSEKPRVWEKSTGSCGSTQSHCTECRTWLWSSPLPAFCPSHLILHCDVGAGGSIVFFKHKEWAHLLGPGIRPQIQTPSPQAFVTFAGHRPTATSLTLEIRRLYERVNFTNSTISGEMEGMKPPVFFDSSSCDGEMPHTGCRCVHESPSTYTLRNG